MPIPTYEDLMLLVLKLAADGQSHSTVEMRMLLATQCHLTEADVQERLESGQTRFGNRVAWATVYLQKSGLLERTKRGWYRISALGLDTLAQQPTRISAEFLMRFPAFVEFKHGRTTEPMERAEASRDHTTSERQVPQSTSTPEEQLGAACRELREAVACELLERVRNVTPNFFERLVVDLLVAMDYGGSRDDAAQVVGKSGDEGIDGVIKEDRLGLDMVYVQAKKWEGSVGPGEIDKFVGSLGRKRAHKGVFITTGTFTDGAQRAARDAAVRIVLIDGNRLAQLMFDYGVGVTGSHKYEIKKMDDDYFEEV